MSADENGWKIRFFDSLTAALCNAQRGIFWLPPLGEAVGAAD